MPLRQSNLERLQLNPSPEVELRQTEEGHLLILTIHESLTFITILLNLISKSLAGLGLSDILLILDFPIGELHMEASNIFQTNLHALLLGRRQQLVLEGFYTGLEAFRVEVSRQLVVH